ncbi:fungal-specific transcription factor domain-containing protein [Ilyonectria destructans]|nr:fungal-specific transcription factor domain-containing protein [Ilyonectria destructans]
MDFMLQRSPQGPHESGRPGKRRRTAVACEECREKKRKCDGVKPTCGTCTSRLSRRCIWREERNSKGWYRDSYVDGLKSRIKELEEAQARAAGTNALNNNDTPTTSPPQPANWESQSRPSVQNVETSLKNLRTDRISIRSLTTARDGTQSASHAPFSMNERRGHGPPGTAFQHVRRNTFDSESTESGVDAMGIASSINGITDPHARPPSAYFGPSSTVNLLGEARTAMCRRPCGHEPLISDGSDPCTICLKEATSFAGSGSGGRNTMFGFSVPPRPEADSLIASYWGWVHSLYPFLHQPSFEKRYLTIWNPQNESESRYRSTSHSLGCYDTLDEKLFYCLLNIVFALGALFNPKIDPHDRDRLSRPFFERSKALLDFDLLAQGSLPLVQALLLMGQYLQSTDMSSSCWNIVGLAIRVAQGIGLHHEKRGYAQGGRQQRVDQVDTEMRKRAWTGCVFLDRVLSLAYGRPLMIHLTKSQNQLLLPSAIDDEFLTRFPEAPGSQPDYPPSKIDCYVQAVKLKEILGQVLTTVYNGGSDTEHEDPTDAGIGSHCRPTSLKVRSIKDDDLQAILNVDGLLTTWRNELPVHLRVEMYKDEPVAPNPPILEGHLMFRRQRIVLEARYLHVRLVMLRPVLSVLSGLASDSSKALQDNESFNTNMRQGMLVKAANLCVSVAQELVNLITVNLNAECDLLPAPWYNVFYIHSCALVLILGLLCSPEYIKSVDESSLTSSWNRCLDFLREYSPRSRSARQCSKILESVEREVFSYRNGDSQFGNRGNIQTGEDLNHENVSAGNLQAEHSSHNDEFPSLHLFQDDSFGLDQAYNPLMNDSSGVTWLSLAPFLDSMEDFGE